MMGVPLAGLTTSTSTASVTGRGDGEPQLRPIAFVDLPGWAAQDHDGALATFVRSAREILATGHGFGRVARFGGHRPDWLPACEASLRARHARTFFEAEFRPFEVADPARPHGLFTGYYEPQADGARKPSAQYPVPIYAKPADLVAFDHAAQMATGLAYGRLDHGTPVAYYSRRDIEQGCLQGRGLELVYLASWEDAFFIHIQGSGRIRLADGDAIRLSYAAKTGRPYTGIGNLLVERGALTPETNSMQAIRGWMRSNPGAARQLTWQNESFVFFRETKIDDPELGALGAQQVNLTPRRSLAVDRAYWMLGTPVWLDTRLPPEAGGARFSKLMVAQDTGTAIRGAARGDVYWGWGDEAALIAGHMKSEGRMVVLLPRQVAARLGLPG